MKITAVTIRDFKGVKDVQINPPADSYLLLIAGENDAGKTSTFDAIASVFGGKAALPAEAVRRGAEKAVVNVELDDGTYRLDLAIPKVGEPSLKVTGPDGRITRPQEWIGKLLGHCFLDPLAFLTAKPPEQRKKLAALVGLDLDAFEAERRKLYDERTAVGRVLTSAQAEMGRLPAPTPRPAEARSQAAIRADLDAIEAEQRAVSEKLAARMRIADRVGSYTESTRRLRAQIAQLQAQLAQQEEQLRTDEAALAAADEQLGAAQDERDPGGVAARVEQAEGRRRALREEAQRAETVARWEAAHQALEDRRRAAEDQVARHAAERDQLTAGIEAIDQRKAAALAAATMPVDGLGITDDGLTLDGLPFGQASKSAQMRCAIAISMAMQPGLKDILIRDGSLIGADRLAMLHAEAMFADCRLWVERVGEKDEGAIIIRDGKVAGGGKAA